MKVSHKILATILIILAWFANHNNYQLVSLLLSVVVLAIIFWPTKK